ncbi:class I SAM-dependent methyltransferase (plasmid) [Rhizobium lusitanum]|uniref:class I SAM-dependent methyltransferase n=1 Tax=Rhizobium lusitanum TaxID=293958 RepID=UPI00161552A7|nr:class I SAM-dependent methyltransferase [Rhizobium lusitanum]QND44627.1 class I SAM-dependent methyltransferase [Rhizobium lusitanum]
MDQGTSVDTAADDAAELIFFRKVKTAHDKLFGARGGPYNIDSVAYFTAAIESYQYAREQMRNAARFDTREALLHFSLDKVSIDGLVLEFGVFSGHTINIMADKLNHKMIYGFDSFKGLPEDWTTGAKAGAFAREGLPSVRENVQLVVGWFDDTLRTFLASHPGNLSFLHVDCDLYSSTRTVLTEARDRIVPGTVILFDEYFNYPDWKRHEYRAFQEFAYENNIKYEYIGLVPAFEQVAARIL